MIYISQGMYSAFRIHDFVCVLFIYSVILIHQLYFNFYKHIYEKKTQTKIHSLQYKTSGASDKKHILFILGYSFSTTESESTANIETMAGADPLKCIQVWNL